MSEPPESGINPYAAPRATITAPDAQEAVFTAEALEQIAAFRKIVVVSFLGSVIVNLAGSLAFSLIVLVAYVGAAYYLAVFLRLKPAALYLVSALLPLVNWITLGVLLYHSGRVLRRNGYITSFWGGVRLP